MTSQSCRNNRHFVQDREESIDFARRQRHVARSPEIMMWQLLRNRNCADAKFRRQFPIGPYTIDFFCIELLLAIECDGADHFTPEGIVRDQRRDAYLAQRSINIKRFENRRIENEIMQVRDEIVNWIRGHRE